MIAPRRTVAASPPRVTRDACTAILTLLIVMHATAIACTAAQTDYSMAWRSSGRTNSELVSNLTRGRLIESAAVAAAMNAVDRALFMPKGSSADVAYQDSPQVIGTSRDMLHT